MNKKYDNTFFTALRDSKAYDFYLNIFYHFPLTFSFLTPKERDLHCSHRIMLRNKQTHTYIYYKFFQHHYTTNTPSQNPQHRFTFINSKYTYPFFLKLNLLQKKDTSTQGISRNYDSIRQLYIFCALTKCFSVKQSRPLIVPHKYIQPIEVQILEYFHNTKYNHNLYNTIQKTAHEFSLSSEENEIIRALELLRPLLQTKYVIRLLAKSSGTINAVFPNNFLADDKP